ncbi:hypothetical protein ACS0TY_016041 [Phlomoides rotata]
MGVLILQQFFLLRATLPTEILLHLLMKFDELNTIKVWIKTFEQDASYIKGFEFCGIYLHEATWESIWSFRRNFLIFCLRTSKKSRGGIVMIEEDEAIFPLEESHEEGRIAAELKHPFFLLHIDHVEFPKELPKFQAPFLGFTRTAEIWNSRACMIGLIGTFIVELILNKGILELIGVEIGKGLDIPL